MSRKRRDGLRPSRTWSEISGVTISTMPSGVTVNSGGIDYGFGAAKMAFGSIVYTGTTASIASASHGLTTLTSFHAIYTDGTGVSPPICRFNTTASGVSIDVQAMTILGGTTMIPASSGGTIKWSAFGS